MKKISIYTQGGETSAVTRYRFMQYFNTIPNTTIYRIAIPNWFYKRYMPIGENNIIVKLSALILMYCRNLMFLLFDLVKVPDIIIISRALLKRVTPHTYIFILKLLKNKGTKIIWDFDDDVLAMKEINNYGLIQLAKLSDKIIIASPYLNEIIPVSERSKSTLITTTDGTLRQFLNRNTIKNRENSYLNNVTLLWVGTSSSLTFVERIIPFIEDAGRKLSKKGKTLSLLVVCNKPLNVAANDFVLINKKWSLKTAEEAFLSSHIGLMPLELSKSTKGKGGFKLIQYISVGLPSIASSVGINHDILSYGGGYLVGNLQSSEWTDSILELSADIHKWHETSESAMRNYDQHYSFERNLNRWKMIIEG